MPNDERCAALHLSAPDVTGDRATWELIDGDVARTDPSRLWKRNHESGIAALLGCAKPSIKEYKQAGLKFHTCIMSEPSMSKQSKSVYESTTPVDSPRRPTPAGVHPDDGTIEFTTTTTPVGCLLVGATSRGVCAVSMGEDARALIGHLRDDFSQAISHEQPGGVMRRWIDPIAAFLDGSTRDVAVSVDLRGTDFQRRVWQQLRKIPYGQTQTYGQIARDLGNPDAAQAVGGAVGANKVALVVPCHRVIRADGRLGGFRWGVERKRGLLRLEQRVTQNGLDGSLTTCARRT